MAIIYDASRLKAYQLLEELCQYTNKTDEWREELWTKLLQNHAMYEEFLYYLDHHSLLGNYKLAGYSIIDFFIWQLDCYNLTADTGKIDARCNKEEMVLNAFYHMLKMPGNEEAYAKKLQKGFGNDKL